MTRHRPTRPFLFAVAFLVTLDLTAKWWAVNHLVESPRPLPGPVDLQLSYNTGIAFGLVPDLSPNVLVTLTAAALAGVIYLWRTKLAPAGPATLFIAGGAANVLDRIEGDGVVDMLHTDWWPTFNIADVFITTGVVWWMIATVLKPDPRDEGTPANLDGTTVQAKP